MHPLRHIAALLLALGAAGCGNLENAPFRVGTVQGRLTESHGALALVSVVGAPGIRSTVAEDGRFTLERVPAGAAELFIIATPEKAMRLAVTVQGGRSVSLGDVEPRAAGFFEVRVKAPGKLRVSGGLVSVEGTPFQRLQVDEKGQLRVGPLADGCYPVRVTAPGFPETAAEACVGNGEKKDVTVNLVAPGGNGHERCEETGCVDGSRCAPNGQCVECYEDAHCGGGGLTCRGFRCEGEGPQCARCAGDWQCGGGASCQDIPEGTPACVAQCDAKTSCGQGFTCQGGRCLPDSAQFEGCHSYWVVGSACDGDERCRAQGLTNGLCAAGACTYRCTTDRECPHGFACEDAPSGAVCLPRK
jgi:hypothetical protein